MTDPERKRVLVVDDASLVRLYYRDALQRANFEVYEALNGLEALEKLLVQTVDLLVVDVNMPQMDGFTFLKTLRRQPTRLRSIPALVTSTESGPQDRLAATRAGANFFLTKPLSQETLIEYANMLAAVRA